MQHLFQSIDSFLIKHQQYWRFEPFFASFSDALLWQQTHPELCSWLSTLSELQIEQYKQDSSLLFDHIGRFFPELKSHLASLYVPELPNHGLQLARGVDSGVPGRKLAQIVSMGEAALAQHHGKEWLEWCSGKGFLGRILASQSGEKVTSFEFQHALCESGQQEADKQHLPMQFVQGDAFDESAKQVFNDKQHAVALHACGDLHVTLLKHGVTHHLPAMTISPCCYHLIKDDDYQALSKQGQASELALTQQELRIPLQELVTGGERVKRHRFLEMSYRLGFELLLREQLGHQQYTPIPSIKKSLLSEGFEPFCQWAAEKKQLNLPQVDFDGYFERGQQRYWQMERLSLVQQLFKRGLEMWLVLDKALYLQQNGYQVSVSEFCSRATTPRNLLIHAQRNV
ncbi:SAM-dependent methyltransferase [Vibrio intestinalis]|uniref:SAM-dependent methyltransferase n=1 Tax=Vibrio intestinalis TaxID=2933291 RepID=UPI0021A4D446|nr:SAM-dependent methyltransferase [Vibrio intestinalis]